MRRARCALLALALVPPAAGCCERRAPGPAAGSPDAPADTNWTVVVVGDSITAWGGGEAGYVTLLEQGLAKRARGRRVAVVNAGVPGDTSADMRARFEDALAAGPGLVCVSAGVNDVWTGAVSLEAYRRNLGAMIRRARAAGAEVCLFTPTPFEEARTSARNRRMERYCEAVRELAREHGSRLADMNAAFWRAKEAAPEAALTTDGVHMNDAGNRVMASAALEALATGGGP